MTLCHFNYDYNAFLKCMFSCHSEAMKANTYKVALITGGNRGLGLQTARELGCLGILAILGVRDLKKGKAAAAELTSEGFHAEAARLDITDPSTHAKAYDYIEKYYGKLDILINNAGIWKEKATASSYVPDSHPTSTMAIDILRETFDTNFFGTVALTQRLLPLMYKAPAGRIVNVSSILGSLTLHSDPASPIYSHKVFAYGASKTALNAFTVHLAHELRDTPIKVNSAHPVWVKTEMGGEGADLDISEGGKTSAWLTTLPANGPTGGYFHMKEPIAW
jgi:NAD(P)-dependent dehydrogenase (short-subunit alcohol dehydrogenase family)